MTLRFRRVAARRTRGAAAPLGAEAAIALAVLSAALQLLVVHSKLAALAVLAPVPLYVALSGRRAGAAVRLAWLTGFCVCFAGFGWLAPTLAYFSAISSPAAWVLSALLAVYHGSRWAVFGWLLARGVQNGWPFWAAAFAAPLAAEQLIPWLFPWHLGSALYDFPLLIQSAELGGPLMVSALVVAGGLLVLRVFPTHVRQRLFDARGERVDGFPLAASVGLTCFWLGAVAFGALRMRQLDAQLREIPSIDVAIVQPNVTQAEATNRAAVVARLLSMTAALSNLESSGPADPTATIASTATPPHRPHRAPQLVVWSESVVPGGLDELRAAELAQGFFTRRAGVPLLFGAGVVSAQASSIIGPQTAFNSAFLSNADGEVCTGCRYDKQLLLPFGEYIPAESWWPWLRERLPNTGYYVPGPRKQPLRNGTHPIAVAICYEDLHAGYVRQQVAAHNAQLIVNLTNDAWFTSTAAAEWHLRLAKLRAVEQRRYFVRATNNGVSAVIDPSGRIVAQAPSARAATLRTRIGWLESKTLYSYVGAAPGWLVAAVALGMALKRRRGAGVDTAPPAPAVLEAATTHT